MRPLERVTGFQQKINNDDTYVYYQMNDCNCNLFCIYSQGVKVKMRMPVEPCTHPPPFLLLIFFPPPLSASDHSTETALSVYESYAYQETSSSSPLDHLSSVVVLCRAVRHYPLC